MNRNRLAVPWWHSIRTVKKRLLRKQNIGGSAHWPALTVRFLGENCAQANFTGVHKEVRLRVSVIFKLPNGSVPSRTGLEAAMHWLRPPISLVKALSVAQHVFEYA